MPIDPVKVKLKVLGGLSAVCANCTHYWQARDAGVPGDACTEVGRCGSPLAGDAFSKYDGWITDFTSLCFVCGEKPRYGIKSGMLIRKIGVCEKHIGMVEAHRNKSVKSVPPATESSKLVDSMVESGREMDEDAGITPAMRQEESEMRKYAEDKEKQNL